MKDREAVLFAAGGAIIMLLHEIKATPQESVELLESLLRTCKLAIAICDPATAKQKEGTA